MAGVTIKANIKISWWFTHLYLPTLLSLCTIFGTEPDMDKVQNVANKAMRITHG